MMPLVDRRSWMNRGQGGHLKGEPLRLPRPIEKGLAQAFELFHRILEAPDGGHRLAIPPAHLPGGVKEVGRFQDRGLLDHGQQPLPGSRAAFCPSHSRAGDRESS
jgi:hypothetical protein